MHLDESIQRAAAIIADAGALLIGAGAGMGVDSGLPDFRGDQGFWRAYPRYAELGLQFAELANPRWFVQDPHLAWGFYGHRLHLYRSTVPHEGFALLRGWAERVPEGAFVFTSNVDGQFQRAGLPGERVLEIHGSIHHLQCLSRCGLGIVSADGITVQIDPVSLRARDPLPRCPRCESLLRPNILMFGDGDWDGRRAGEQHALQEAWLGALLKRGTRLAIVECGAGMAIPSVRRFCAQAALRAGTPLIRINPREPEPDLGGYQHIGIPLGARAALQAIAAQLDKRQGLPDAVQALLTQFSARHGGRFVWEPDRVIAVTNARGAWFCNTRSINGRDDSITVHPSPSGTHVELVLCAAAGHVEVYRLSVAELATKLDEAMGWFAGWTSFFARGPGQGH
jgi:NAD-dependent SIR2 family protein deacetylase